MQSKYAKRMFLLYVFYAKPEVCHCPGARASRTEAFLLWASNFARFNVIHDHYGEARCLSVYNALARVIGLYCCLG